jgi:hypothetical protein
MLRDAARRRRISSRHLFNHQQKGNSMTATIEQTTRLTGWLVVTNECWLHDDEDDDDYGYVDSHARVIICDPQSSAEAHAYYQLVAPLIGHRDHIACGPDWLPLVTRTAAVLADAGFPVRAECLTVYAVDAIRQQTIDEAYALLSNIDDDSDSRLC